MKKQKKQKLTTIAVYKKDVEYLKTICKRDEMFRDKIREIFNKHKKGDKKR